MKHRIGWCLAVLCLSLGWGQTASMPVVGWPARDGLGRSLPGPEEVGPPRPDRFVGLFYFLWLNLRTPSNPNHEGPYDVSRILAHDPEALGKPDSPLWGRVGTYHYWAEPLYGYYLSTDPWVLRRHAHLLTDAGIDVLIFDTTNAQTYPETHRALCEVFLQVRQEEGRAPGIAFMVNTRAGATAEKIYRELYQPGRFRELWFTWEGKPLMLCDPEQASSEVRDFFTLRRAHWPFTLTNTPYAWHWEATYPQPYGFTDDPLKPEQVNVSVAQNLRRSDGKVTNMSDGNARGRSFHNGRVNPAPDAVLHGYNVQEQWTRAFELQPPFVMVTGWNEWIAGRWGEPQGPIRFVDQYDHEHSRDIEPMKGGHQDNYYLQLAANVRRFKGATSLPAATPLQTIQIDAGFGAWHTVGPEYPDHLGETLPRDFPGAGGLHYINRSGRNDLEASKVARDTDNVYFMVKTRQPISPSNGSNWMWLLIDADVNAETGWEGYDFVINRSVEEGRSWLEKHSDGWSWEKVIPVDFRLEGNQLHLAVPRAALGLSSEPIALDFKWADHLQAPGDVMDFYISGDVAPEGRFRYRYRSD